jgi:hypothetical protein
LFAGTFIKLSVAVSLAVPLFAHHSVAAEYDTSKLTTFKGVVASVDWINPHAYVFVDIRNESGEVARWKFETASPNALVQRGWKRGEVKEGEQVTITAYRAKSEENLGAARKLVTADGRELDCADTFGPSQVH